MTPDVKAQWLAALRSGVYKQAQGRLKRDDAYCCLGVLCSIYAQTHKAFFTDPDYFTSPDKEFDVLTIPPRQVIEWADITDHIASSLANMNDNGVPFNDIADYIEREL